jgi:hypothetical protein
MTQAILVFINLDTFSDLDTIVVGGASILLIAFLLLLRRKIISRRQSLMLSSTSRTANASLNASVQVLFSLSYVDQTLNLLSEVKNPHLSQEEIIHDKSKVVEIVQQVKAIEDPLNRAEFFYSQVRPFLKRIRTKYSDFIPNFVSSTLEDDEWYLSLKELIESQCLLVSAVKEESDQVSQSQKLYMGIARLSEVLESHITYFSPNLFGLLESIKALAESILSEPELKPNKASQLEPVFTNAIGIRNAAKVILFKLEEYSAENKPQSEVRLGQSRSHDSWKLVTGELSYDELVRESQARIRRLDELNPKTDKEAEEQAETLNYLIRNLSRDIS